MQAPAAPAKSLRNWSAAAVAKRSASDHSLAHGSPVERRVQTSTVDSLQGGFLVADDLLPPIERLREKLIIRRLGATVLGGLQGNLTIPRLTASASGTWTGENQAITASSETFDALTMSARHVGGIVELSRNMIMQASVDVARMAQSDLIQVIAVAMDKAALAGTGSNSQPLGLFNQADAGQNQFVAGGNGGAPTWAMIISAIAAVDTSNALQGSLAWATNAKVVSKLRQTLKTTEDTSSNFIIGDDPSSLAGYPLVSSQVVPSNLTRGSSVGTCSALVFGDWSQLLLAFWSEMDVIVNPYGDSAFSKGNVQVRVMTTADVNFRHLESFTIMPDMVTS